MNPLLPPPPVPVDLSYLLFPLVTLSTIGGLWVAAEAPVPPGTPHTVLLTVQEHSTTVW